MGNKNTNTMSEKSQFQERLVSLFLRLNGYLQTGYIPHSDIWGNAGTDIDRIGLRFPFHSQPERKVKSSPYLKIPETSIDIIIAEVKSSKLKFNDTLKKDEDRAIQNWEQIFRWLGLFEKEEIDQLVPKAKDIVNLNGDKSINNGFQILEHKNRFGEISIRPILFVIDKEYKPESSKIWIDGITLLNYFWECFCPEVKNIDCSTRYPLKLWGTEYEDIVDYLKNRHEQGLNKGTLDDMYKSFVNE